MQGLAATDLKGPCSVRLNRERPCPLAGTGARRSRRSDCEVLLPSEHVEDEEQHQGQDRRHREGPEAAQPVREEEEHPV